MDPRKQKQMVSQLFDSTAKSQEELDKMTPEERREYLRGRLKQRMFFSGVSRQSMQQKKKLQEKIEESTNKNNSEFGVEIGNTVNKNTDKNKKRKEKKRAAKAAELAANQAVGQASVKVSEAEEENEKEDKDFELVETSSTFKINKNKGWLQYIF